MEWAVQIQHTREILFIFIAANWKTRKKKLKRWGQNRKTKKTKFKIQKKERTKKKRNYILFSLSLSLSLFFSLSFFESLWMIGPYQRRNHPFPSPHPLSSPGGLAERKVNGSLWKTGGVGEERSVRFLIHFFASVMK